MALKLSAIDRLDEICAKFSLTAERDDQRSVVILSNRSTFGCTEYECIKRVHDGVAELVSEQSIKTKSPTKENAMDDNGNIAANNDHDQQDEYVENPPPEDSTADANKVIDDTSFVIERSEEATEENVKIDDDTDKAEPEAIEQPEENPPNAAKNEPEPGEPQDEEVE